MGTTVLCDLDQFERDVLPLLPPEKLQYTLPTDAVDQAKATLSALFYKGGKKPREVKEDHIAETVVDKVLEKIAFPSKYKVALSRFKYDSSDPSRAKVDAAIYPEDRVPSDEAPDWTHCRFLIEFKKGDTKYDPWNDDKSKNVEAERESRAAARAQLIAYARNVFLYQQRTALFTLLIIGDEFRVSRWDRSGVIVTKKVNYSKDPKRLLEVLWHLVQLDEEQQGIDPSATLIEKDSKAFKIMDWLAAPNSELDMDFEERKRVNAECPPTPYTHSDPYATEVDPELDPIVPVDDDPRVFKYVREKFRDSLVPGWPRYKLRVGPEGRIFLVGKPIFCSSTMFGRATEGFIAVEARTRRFAFLKDSWRPFYEGVEPEGTYLEMFARDVPEMIVPVVLCHGDVAEQCAFAAVYEADPKRRKKESLEASQANVTRANHGTKRARPEDEQEAADVATPTEGTVGDNGTLRHHIHYRIAVKDVCLPFESFKTTEQFIRLMCDCVQTHALAYERKGLLHRDISAGNVLILPRVGTNRAGKEVVSWHGVLTDWELAKEIQEDASQAKARQPERTGTWQFMSVAYVHLQCSLPVAVADELESFFHVLIFYAVRFLPHKIPEVSAFVSAYFDTFQPDGKCGRRCSQVKYTAVHSRDLRFAQGQTLTFLKTTREPGNPLNGLIRKLRRLLNARYRVFYFEVESGIKELGTAVSSESALGAAATDTTSLDLKSDGESSEDPGSERVSDESSDDESEEDTETDPNSDSDSDSETDAETAPTTKTRELAERLDHHAVVLKIFQRTIASKRKSSQKHLWKDTGITPDKLINYEPRIILANEIRASYQTGSRTTGSQAKRLKSSARAVATSSALAKLSKAGSSSGIP
ncbi:hypothetical protein C8Q77DRAFT_1074780 [Trametes polyzona]|nr:hypothetical protein C8Q77DRAFT_1074780 [Trametes polyzona]